MAHGNTWARQLPQFHQSSHVLECDSTRTVKAINDTCISNCHLQDERVKSGTISPVPCTSIMDLLSAARDVFMPQATPTKGLGTIGFGNLTYMQALHRWLQAWAAPDLRYLDIVKWAMPMFFVLIGVEFLASLMMKKRVYYLRQFWSNLVGGGISFVLLGVLLRGGGVFPYLYVHERFALRRKQDLVAYLIAFFGHDLMHYTAHRYGHYTNLGWAVHNVHHSSPDYNFTTGMRLGPDLLVHFWLFFLPMALVVPPEVFFVPYGLGYVYQFFVHTELVDKLPWPLEFFFATPSHHRVHHARNYPRANYGATLIIWDRIFGTFMEERPDRPCLFGLDARQTPLGTASPVWHQVQHLHATLKAARKAEGWDKLKMLFTRQYGPGMVKPGITDAAVDAEVEKPAHGIPCDPRMNLMDVYVGIHSALVLAPGGLALMLLKVSLNPIHTIVLTFMLIYGSHTVFCLLDDQKDWKAWKSEIRRLCLSSLVAIWVFDYALAAPFVLSCIFSGLVLTPIYRHVHLEKID